MTEKRVSVVTKRPSAPVHETDVQKALRIERAIMLSEQKAEALKAYRQEQRMALKRRREREREEAARSHRLFLKERGIPVDIARKVAEEAIRLVYTARQPDGTKVPHDDKVEFSRAATRLVRMMSPSNAELRVKVEDAMAEASGLRETVAGLRSRIAGLEAELEKAGGMIAGTANTGEPT